MGNVIRQVLNRTLCHLSGLDCVQKVKKIGNYQDKISEKFLQCPQKTIDPKHNIWCHTIANGLSLRKSSRHAGDHREIPVTSY